MDTALAEEQNTAQIDAVQSVFLAVLNAPGLDIRDKKAAIIDFIAAGIQTVRNHFFKFLFTIFSSLSNIYFIYLILVGEHTCICALPDC